VPLRDDLLTRAGQALRQLSRAQRALLETHSAQLEAFILSYGLRRPLRRLSDFQQTLDGLSARLARGFRGAWRREQEGFAALTTRLESVNPISILRRGYAVVQNAAGQTIRSAEQVKIGDPLRVRFHKGSLSCDVRAIEPKREAPWPKKK
jgi:exodeoxyribonuclease VII large subunit